MLGSMGLDVLQTDRAVLLGGRDQALASVVLRQPIAVGRD
jgi:hypothetical protein